MDAALFVDWSARAALDALQLAPAVAVLFLCFRVFHTSSELCGSLEELAFYRTAETAALQRARGAVALSATDARRAGGAPASGQ